MDKPNKLVILLRQLARGSLLSLVAATMMVGAPAPADAATRYAVNLTRKGSNFYRVDGQKVWVQTRYCYTYGYGEEASLSAFDVVFLDSGDKCDVRRVLQEADVSPGTYKLQLTHESDNLYSTLGGTFIKTDMCLHLGIGDEALVRIGPGGLGTVQFLDSKDRCPVEVVLTQMRL